MSKPVAAMAVASLALGAFMVPVASPTADAGTVRYKNCAQLTKKYPHGVKRDARTLDRSAGKVKRVQPRAVVNAAVYKANTHLDADRDGIACER